MRRPKPQLGALVALAVMVAPWLSAVILALHLDHHLGSDHDNGEAGAGLAAVHGHDHHPGTPEHQHVLTLPAGSLGFTTSLLAGAVALAAVGEVTTGDLLNAGHAGGSTAGPWHDPPAVQRSISILRV